MLEDAPSTGALLPLDEADALFGKRTEVKDSHDRFANIEISYLFELVEAHRGGVIFATKSSEDPDRTFLKRTHFVVEFA